MTDGVLAGDVLLAELRGLGRERPSVDPSLVGDLRSILENAAAPVHQGLAEDVTIRVSKTRLRQVLLCERHLVASLEVGAVAPTPELVRGRLLDRTFIHVAMGYPLGDDPVADALAAGAIAGDADLVDDWEALSVDDQSEVRATVESWGSALAARWPALPGSALLRLQEPLRVELAGGRIVLVGRVDVALGVTAADRAGTTLIDVKSGKRRHDDLHDAAWYALLETIRHQAAPFQSGNYYLRDGSLELEVAHRDWLESEASRVGDAVQRLIRLAAGEEPAVTPSGICPWCPAFKSCDAGRRYSYERGREPDTWDPSDEFDADDDDGDDF